MIRHVDRIEALVRDHIFTVQQIEDPERLWRLAAPRIKVAHIRQIASSGDIAGTIVTLARMMVGYPIPVVQYAISHIKRRNRRLTEATNRWLQVRNIHPCTSMKRR
jgi:hypothetical protein